MLNERQNTLLKLLDSNEQTSVKEFAEKLKVSSVTIRQDLNFLESQGFLKRVHGGAVLADDDDISNRLGTNYEVKLRIARKLSNYVADGETVLIESGSVNALLARELVKKKRISIITTNIYIARQFRKNEQANIIILGGIYQHQSESMIGKITKLCIDNINFDKAFIGIDGYTAKTGFTLRDMFRAEISSHIIKKSTDVFIVSDSSKFGNTEITNICSCREIQHIATDDGLGVQFQKEFSEAGIDLILA